MIDRWTYVSRRGTLLSTMSRPVAVTALALCTLMATVGCSSEHQSSPAEVEDLVDELAASTVVYDVGGSVDWADVTMETPDGTEQITPDVPMVTNAGRRGLRFLFESGSFVYLSAQKKDEFGTIRCRIKVDGVVISENTSDAAYGIATCKGRI